jgi:hypothetical protein
MAISDTSVARLDRGERTLALTGVSPVVTTLKLLLGGSASMPELGDIVEEIPLEVAKILWTKIDHKLYGTFSAPCMGSMVGTLYSKGPLVWSGTTFFVQVEDYDLVRNGEPPFQLTITGTLSQDLTKVETLSYRRYRKYQSTYTSPNTGKEMVDYSEDLYEWSVTNVPLVSDPKMIPGGGLARYEIRGPAAASALRNFIDRSEFYSGPKEGFIPANIKRTQCSISFSGPNDGIAILLAK